MSFVLAPAPPTTEFFTLSSSSGDSISRASSSIPQEIHDIGQFMDRMVESVISMHEAPRISTVIWTSDNSNEYFPLQQDQQHQDPHREHANMLVDSAVHKIVTAKETPEEEIPKLASDLQSYGHKMLEAMDPAAHDLHRHIGRRLTEVDPATIQHHVRLPFSCPKNRCLQASIAAHRVSRECVDAVSSLEKMFVIEEEAEKEEFIFLSLMWLYMAIFGVLMVMVARRYRADRGRQLLAQRVLMAVYASPDLKEKVEEDLGESIGEHAPVPVKILLGSGAAMKRRLQCLSRAHAIFLVAMVALVFIAPFWVLPTCIVLTAIRVVQLCVIGSGTDASHDDCTCCCCAATPSLAKAGMLSKEQECCNCCKGTGFCSDACKSCCGGCGGCGCNGKDCCCCDGVLCSLKEATVTNDCTCCCCAATPSLAKAGMLSKEQECCNCCKGTGVCSDACKSCCGGCGGCGCNGKDCCCCDDAKKDKNTVLKARCAVYEGVPIQIV
jgi:hypothetical protein